MKLIACILAVLIVFNTPEVRATTPQKQQPHTYAEIVEKVAVEKINRFVAHAKTKQVKSADVEAFATSLQSVVEVYSADGTFKRMDAEIASHREDILSFVPNSENIETLHQNLRQRGITASTREDVTRIHTKTPYERQIAIDQIRKIGTEKLFRRVVKHLSARAVAMRTGITGNFCTVQGPGVGGEPYTLCDMMDQTSGVLGVVALFGCVPCGFGSAVGFGMALACQYWPGGGGSGEGRMDGTDLMPEAEDEDDMKVNVERSVPLVSTI
jgi:hypothetical protein